MWCLSTAGDPLPARPGHWVFGSAGGALNNYIWQLLISRAALFLRNKSPSPALVPSGEEPAVCSTRMLTHCCRAHKNVSFASCAMALFTNVSPAGGNVWCFQRSSVITVVMKLFSPVYGGVNWLSLTALPLFSGEPSLTQERGVRVQGSSSNPFDANQCVVKDTRAARGLADHKKRWPLTVRRGSGFPGKQAFVLLGSPCREKLVMLQSRTACRRLKRDVADSRVSKETVFLLQAPLLSLPTLPKGFLHGSCTSWFTQGKVWCRSVGNEKMCPLLSTSLCSTSSSHFPLVVFEPPALRFGKAVRRGCRCYARCCSVLWRPKPWEREALRNVGKYSFRLTPFLLLSDVAATPSPVHDLG